jgi:hypothetical protein
VAPPKPAVAPPLATTLMLRVYNGSLTYYRDPVLDPNIYDRWFRLNVIHDLDASNVTIYIDGVPKHAAPGRGGEEEEEEEECTMVH